MAQIRFRCPKATDVLRCRTLTQCLPLAEGRRVCDPGVPSGPSESRRAHIATTSPRNGNRPPAPIATHPSIADEHRSKALYACVLGIDESSMTDCPQGARLAAVAAERDACPFVTLLVLPGGAADDRHWAGSGGRRDQAVSRSDPCPRRARPGRRQADRTGRPDSGRRLNVAMRARRPKSFLPLDPPPSVSRCQADLGCLPAGYQLAIRRGRCGHGHQLDPIVRRDL